MMSWFCTGCLKDQEGEVPKVSKCGKCIVRPTTWDELLVDVTPD